MVRIDMSGECDDCGEHCLECGCGEPKGKPKIILEWLRYPKNKPADDDNVLVINDLIESMTPHKAYYCVQSDEFLSLETICTVPVSVTHYMPMPTIEWS